MSDLNNCGGCGNQCSFPHAVAACAQGKCTVARCSDPFYADCSDEPGCETMLGTAANCAACGDQACALANTLLSCSAETGCQTAACAPGFANCDASSPDCETSFANGATCLPGYLGTTAFATQASGGAAVTIGTDGSFFIAGEFTGTVDFNPGAGQDIRTTAANDTDAFITKLNADGTYAWTATLVGRGLISIRALAPASGGAVVAAGSYDDSVDLDPGAGVDLHQTAGMFVQDSFVVKLAADGSFVWGRDFPSGAIRSSSDYASVAVDAADAVYLAGSFEGTVDFDPGAGTTSRMADQQTAVLVKMTDAGALAWTRTIENGTCISTLTSVAVASDGAVWVAGAAGAATGCPLGSPNSIDASSSAVVAIYSAIGDTRGPWMLGGPTSRLQASAVAPGPNGSMYVGGNAQPGAVDFDPGPGVVKRSLFGGFVTRLGADASLLWVQSLPDLQVTSLAGTADGGVLSVGYANGGPINKLNADGTGGWSFALGNDATAPVAVAARAGNFAVAGPSRGSGDFDPGAGVDIVFGDIVFLSRFRF